MKDTMERRYIETIQKIMNNAEKDAVLVLVVSTTGSAPQKPGARMLVSSDGLLYGTVGGGTIEAMATEHAVKMLQSDQPTDFRTYDMSKSEGSGIVTGMKCGGSISLYFENVRPPDRLILYGCGHIGSILAPVAVRCGFHVIGIDQRSDMTDPKRFQWGDSKCSLHLECCNPVEHASHFVIRNSDSIVIMTHNHRFDTDVLLAYARRFSDTYLPRYIGMIGSVSKVHEILQHLADNNVPQSVISTIKTPVGLRTGGASPGEIAISIMGEILAVKHRTISDGFVSSMCRI